MNNQPPEKRRLGHDGQTLEVHSVFYTIQGEGPFTGRSAVFIRLAGCNLQCPGCDTEYTAHRDQRTTNNLVSEVKLHNPPGFSPLVVITGGEPFRQNITPLVRELLRNGFTVQIETNGTLPPPTDDFSYFCSRNFLRPNLCFVVCSPKTGKVHPATEKVVAAYKYVLSADDMADDGLPQRALGHSAEPCVARPPAGFDGPVYVQPCDTGNHYGNYANRTACVQSVMEHGYTLQLQTHKIIEVA